MQILVLGDSISLGCADRDGGWVQKLKYQIDTFQEIKYYPLVYNLSVSGDTTRSLIKRFSNEIEKLEPSEFTIIIAIGENDAAFSRKKNSYLVPEEEFKENIRKLINLSKKYSNSITLVGPTLIDESLCNPWTTFDFYLKNDDIENYNKIIKSICESEKINFIDILHHFKREDYKKLLFDGLHPNSKGHDFMFGIIKESLEKNKTIEF
jgi:lysophospholipase L1-like esterase